MPNTSRKFRPLRARRGFTIIELLVAIIIIGILVTILVPVVSNRAEQARVARVNADLENIASSMERVAIDTGYFVRLFALNDVLQGDNVAFSRPVNINDVTDGLTDYTIANTYIQFPTNNSLFILPSTGDFSPGNRIDIINTLLASETRYDGSVSWGGPYINAHKDSNLQDNLVAPDGVPDDPWGNNYLFFTQVGLVLEPEGTIVTGAVEDSTGGFNSGSTFDCEIFDRPTVVSLGPNGRPGTPGDPVAANQRFGAGDDFKRQFGR